MNEVLSPLFDRYRVIDVDAHLSEPPDLWTSRLASKWGDLIPTVRPDRRGSPRWFIGDSHMTTVATYAVAGWTEYPPAHPKSLEEADPATWDAAARLRHLDRYSMHAQVLYPNLLGFHSQTFLRSQPPDLATECVRAYNDYMAEFCSADPTRLIPIMVLPFWDIDASQAEIQRAFALGHKGVAFGADMPKIGYPGLADPHWDPILATAQECGLSINFHVGFAEAEDTWSQTIRAESVGAMAGAGSLMMLGNARTIVEVITSGLCHRYPDLNFVSVESGCGWLPFLLDCLDWNWQNFGAHKEHPDWDLPSDYFRRQIYGSFWFEHSNIKEVLAVLPDNFMFETDFPHPTCLSPGPCSISPDPGVHIEGALAGLSDHLLQKVLHDNAARLYHLDEFAPGRIDSGGATCT